MPLQNETEQSYLDRITSHLNPDQIPFEGLNRLLKHWRACRAEGMPLRRDFGPARIVEAAKSIVILEYLRTPEGCDFRVRYVGTELAPIYGEITGKLMSEIPPAIWRNATVNYLRTAAESGLPIWNHVAAIPFEGKRHLQNNILYLPLSDDGEKVAAVLVAAHLTFRPPV